MARIDASTLRDWNNGETMNDVDYEKEREIIRVAINDNFDRLIKKFEVLDSAGTLRSTQNLDTAINYLRFQDTTDIVLSLDTTTSTLSMTVVDGSVTTTKLRDLGVTTAKIADGNVTTIKIADGNVTTAKIANLGVTTPKLADGSVTTVKIANGNVTTGKLADGSVTTGKLANSAVDLNKANLSSFDSRYYTETEVDEKFSSVGGGQAYSFRSGTSFPTNVSEGDVFYRSDLDKTYYYTGSTWIDHAKQSEVTNHENRLVSVEGNLSKAEVQKQELIHGTQIVGKEGNPSSPLKVEVYGQTRVNLMGKLGNFENDSDGDGIADGWVVAFTSATGITKSLSTTSKYATKAQRISSDGTNTTKNGYRIERKVTLENGKYYVFIADFHTTVAGNSRIDIGATTKSGTLANTWETLFVKFAGDGTTQTLRLFGADNNANTAVTTDIDGARLIEVSQSVYNEIGVSLLDADIQRLFPYVDSVQHVKNPVLSVEGDNLADTFYEAEQSGSPEILSSYKAKVSSANKLTFKIPVVGGSTISTKVISSASNGRIYYDFQQSDGSNVPSVYGNKTGSGELKFENITVPSSAVQIKIQLFGTDTVNVEMSDLMLNLGSTAKPFVPRNPSYVIAETTLAGNDSKKDVLHEVDGNWKKQKNWETDVKLDGTLGWSFVSDFTGYKRATANITSANNTIQGNETIVKYDGLILKITRNNPTKADQGFLHSDNGNVYISISDTDTGWLDAWTGTELTADWIKAYFNGWKYNGDGTTHSWASIVDGTAPSTNTLAYVSANQAPNFTPYELTYELADSVTETVQVEGDVSVSYNQAEVGTGVIVREEANPVLYNGAYRINDSYLNTGTSSYLDYKVAKILTVYKNGNEDPKWSHATNKNYLNGEDGVWIPEADFDTTATYTVTYELLDKYKFTTNTNNVKVTYNQSIRSSLDDVVTKQSDIATEVSIHDRQILDILLRLDAGGL